MIYKYMINSLMDRLSLIANTEAENTEYQDGVNDVIDYVRKADKEDIIYIEDIEIWYITFKMHTTYRVKDYNNGVNDMFNVIRKWYDEEG